MTDLLTAAQAAARLGVKRETVYAYVSRGLLVRHRDGRTSWFDPAEVDRLVLGGRRTSLHEFGRTSRLSTLHDGVIHYRGTPVNTLIDRSFESVAHFLWTGRWDAEIRWSANSRSVKVARRVLASLPAAAVASDRLRVTLATVTAADPFRSDFSTQAAVHTAGTLLQTLVEAMPVRSPVAGDGLAALLWSRLSTLEPTRAHLRVLNAAMVLLADHGLSSSTHAAQIAASARADLYGVLAAGLGVGSGAVLGASATAVEVLLASFGDSHETKFAVTARLRDEDRLPGFGHPQHPGGDGRATQLLRLLRPMASSNERLRRSFEVIALLRRRRLPPPNAYLALGMISDSFAMTPSASEVIFGISRAAGWIAHAIDEYETGTLRRLRESDAASPRAWSASEHMDR